MTDLEGPDSLSSLEDVGGKGGKKGGNGKAAKQTCPRPIKRGQTQQNPGGISHVWHAVLTGRGQENLDDHHPSHIRVKSIFIFK